MTASRKSFLSSLLRRAWAAVKNKGMKLADAMRWSWKVAKGQSKQEEPPVKFYAEKETAKAVGVKVYVECYATDQEVTRMLWLPKSMLLADGRCPAWFWAKKVAEVLGEFSYYGGGGTLTLRQA